MHRNVLYTALLLLLGTNLFGQGIRMEHKINPDKSRTIRTDKPVLVRTFDGVRAKGMVRISGDTALIVEEKVIDPDDIMMIAGFVIRSPREKAIGVGLTIGAGIVLVPALYYILGGIAWAMPNGIFVGATVLVFDLLLGYAGTNLLGIYPRRFSTMNWKVVLSDIPLPIPSG